MTRLCLLFVLSVCYDQESQPGPEDSRGVPVVDIAVVVDKAEIRRGRFVFVLEPSPIILTAS